MKTALATVALLGFLAFPALAAEPLVPSKANSAALQQPATGPVRLTDAQLDQVVGGIAGITTAVSAYVQAGGLDFGVNAEANGVVSLDGEVNGLGVGATIDHPID